MFYYPPFVTTVLLGPINLFLFRTLFKEVQDFLTLSRGGAAAYKSPPSPFHKWELGQAYEGTLEEKPVYLCVSDILTWSVPTQQMLQ
jgi:hypothetical protein